MEVNFHFEIDKNKTVVKTTQLLQQFPSIFIVLIATFLFSFSLSIIAVQEVEDIKALQAICDELNKPKLRRVTEWNKNSKDWCISLLDTKNSGLGFLYDAYSAGNYFMHVALLNNVKIRFQAIEVELKSIKQGLKELRHKCEAVVGSFRIGELIVNLINTKINDAVGYDVNDINFKLEEVISSTDVTLVLGDFSHISGGFGKFQFFMFFLKLRMCSV